MRLAVYAGVFDPPTVAHVEIVERALLVFDRVRVVVAVNASKGQAMFSAEERVELLEASLSDGIRGRVDVVAHAGLVAPYARSLGASALVRGMRPGIDPDHEIALAQWNENLEPGLPTLLLVSSPHNTYLSSSFVRETALLGGTILPGSVSPAVEAALREKILGPAPRNSQAHEPAGRTPSAPGAE
jgi:pantetheine-phosphate adenylyltransferase